MRYHSGIPANFKPMADEENRDDIDTEEGADGEEGAEEE